MKLKLFLHIILFSLLFSSVFADNITIFDEENNEEITEEDFFIELPKITEQISVQTAKASLSIVSNKNKVETSSIEGEEIELEEDQIIPWGIERINAPNVWDKAQGNNVKVAILDTGIDYNHQDLKVKGGISFIDNDYMDYVGHGTSIAGVISSLNNSFGIIGTAPGIELYAIKVMNESGGKLSNIIKGIDWSIENDIDVISISFGTPTYSRALEYKLAEAYNEGIIIIGAAGNGGDEVWYPARYDSVIAVGSIDENNDIYSSNFGDELELVAPGRNIITTSSNYGFVSISGTSLAAPHVVGIIGLILSDNPSLSPNEIRMKLQRDAIDLGTKGKDNIYGYGLAQIRFQEENLNATIVIVMPEVKDQEEKEELEIDPIKVEIYKKENEELNIIHTLFYVGDGENKSINVKVGEYSIVRYFNNDTITDVINITENEIIYYPLHKGVAHRYITEEASKIWSTHEILYYLENIRYNSGEEPGPGLVPGCNHFWDPDTNGYLDCGSKSAYTLASEYWNTALTNYPSNKPLAYAYIGSVTHLLEDMSIPAHVLLDPHPFSDSYEDYMGTHYSNYNSIGLNYVYKSSLYGLFYSIAEISDNFDSDDRNGEVDLGLRNVCNGLCTISDSKCADIGDTLMPEAMKHVAGLYNLFWRETSDTGCPGSSCCDSYDHIKEQGLQPNDISDINICKDNNVWHRDYFCGGDSVHESYYDNFVKYCNSNEQCINGQCLIQSCIIPTDDMRINANTKLCKGTYNLPKGISIEAPNIILDCQGSTLQGQNNGEGISIDNETASTALYGITIKNCILKNYNYGISVYGSTNNFLINNSIYYSLKSGIFGYKTKNIVIQNNKIEYGESGIQLQDVTNTDIIKNIVNYATKYAGIRLSNSHYNIIDDNFIYKNCYSNPKIDYPPSGLRIENSNNNKVRNNFLFNNSYNNIYVYNSNNNLIINNSIYDTDITDNNEQSNTYCVDSYDNDYYDGAQGPTCQNQDCINPGTYSIYEKDYVTYGNNNYYDYCENDKYLDEYICKYGYAVADPYECEFGCENGACKRPPTCTDSDGDNIYSRGNVWNGSQYFIDYCFNPNYVEEYTCSVTNETIPVLRYCTYGCENGRCLTEELCIDNDNDGYGDNGVVSCLSTSIDCDDSNPSIHPGATEICNGIDDNCDGTIDETQDLLCDDGLYCNGEETCGGINGCRNGLAPNCDDGIMCTINTCDEATDSCRTVTDDSLCDDNLYCNGEENCDGLLGCRSGTPVVCSDNDVSIDECTNEPDGISYTYDSYIFVSSCSESQDSCTNAGQDWNKYITHTCSKAMCNAECETDSDCQKTDCDNLDGCNGEDYYDYSDIDNICLSNCICSNNQCSNPLIIRNDERCDIPVECNTVADTNCDGVLSNLELAAFADKWYKNQGVSNIQLAMVADVWYKS